MDEDKDDDQHVESLRDHGDEFAARIEEAIRRIVDARLDVFRRELATEREAEAARFCAAFARELQSGEQAEG